MTRSSVPLYSTALGGFDFTTFLEAAQSVNLVDVQSEPSVTILNNRTATLVSVRWGLKDDGLICVAVLAIWFFPQLVTLLPQALGLVRAVADGLPDLRDPDVMAAAWR